MPSDVPNAASRQWVEDVLDASGILALPSEELVVDVTEHPIERPKNKQCDWYSGKKRYTLQSQIVVNLRTLLIDCVHED